MMYWLLWFLGRFSSRIWSYWWRRYFSGGVYVSGGYVCDGDDMISEVK